jgi:hypothetical protein
MLRDFRSGRTRNGFDRRTLSKTEKTLTNLPFIIYCLFCFDLVIYNYKIYYYLYYYLNILDTVLILVSFLHFFKSIAYEEVYKYSVTNLICIFVIIGILVLQYYFNYSQNYINLYKRIIALGGISILINKLLKYGNK